VEKELRNGGGKISTKFVEVSAKVIIESHGLASSIKMVKKRRRKGQ